MTDNGLEWLGRLIPLNGITNRTPPPALSYASLWIVSLPQGLWQRYLIDNPLFLYRVLKQRPGLLLRFEKKFHTRCGAIGWGGRSGC
jgi:hypothetical protein